MDGRQFAALVLLFFITTHVFAQSCGSSQVPSRFACALTSKDQSKVYRSWDQFDDNLSCVKTSYWGAYQMSHLVVLGASDQSLISAVTAEESPDVEYLLSANREFIGDVAAIFSVTRSPMAMGTFESYKVHASIGSIIERGIRVESLQVQETIAKTLTDSSGHIDIQDPTRDVRLTCVYDIK